MDFKELKQWALANHKKDNLTLLSEGVKDNRFTKVKALTKAIAERCDIITENTEKTNKHIAEIEDYLKFLSNYGLTPPVKETKPEEPETVKKLEPANTDE